MDAWLRAFKHIAPYLSHPLVLIGFVLLLFFGIHGKLIDAGIIPPLDPQAGGAVVHAILRYGFWIALVVVVLGFVHQFVKGRRRMTGNTVTVDGGVGAGENIHARDISVGGSSRKRTAKKSKGP